MERLQIMESLVAIMETGSFSAAAKRMNIGQPAISKGIASLEKQLGTRLFIRSTRGITPSDAGMKFYEQAREILAQVETLMSSTQDEQGKLTGNIRVSAPVTLTRNYVLPRLADFLRLNPMLNVELLLNDRNTDLIRDGVDVSLRVGHLPDSAFTATRLHVGQRYIMATPDYLALHGVPQQPKDLLSHQAVIYNVDNSGINWVLQKGKQSQQIILDGKITTNSSEAVRDCVLDNLGFTINSEWMFRDELISGKVVKILPDWELEPLTLWALYPTGTLVSGKVKSFIHFVKSCF